VAASQAHTRWRAQSALGASRSDDLARGAVSLIEVRAFVRFDISHDSGLQFSNTLTEVYVTRRNFIAVSVFLINIAIVNGPTPPGTGVR
jgi:hypothetical protein